MFKKAGVSSFPRVVFELSLIGVSRVIKCIPKEYAARMPAFCLRPVAHYRSLCGLPVYLPS